MDKSAAWGQGYMDVADSPSLNTPRCPYPEGSEEAGEWLLGVIQRQDEDLENQDVE